MSRDLNLNLTLRATDKGLVGSVRITKKELQALNREAGKTGKAAGVASKGLDVSTKKTKELGRQARGTTGQLGSLKGMLAGLGIGMLIKDIISTNVEFENLRASLVTVTGSTELAEAAFSGLEEMAAKTPYSVSEMVAAFTKLTSMGLDPSERALNSYGNTAGAMGKSLNQMIEAVADAATGEFERLKEFGIKSRSEGDKVTFTFKGMSTTVKKEAASIEGYLMKLGETDFAGGMDRQSKTLGGALSNLGDAWDRLLDRMISDEGSTGLQAMIRGIGYALDWLSEESVPLFQGVVIAGIATIQKAFINLKASTIIIWESIKAAGIGVINFLKEGMAETLSNLAASLDFVGLDKMSAKVRGFANDLTPLSSAYDDLVRKSAQLSAARDLEIKTIDDAVIATLLDIGADKKKVISLGEVAKKLKVNMKATATAAKEYKKYAKAQIDAHAKVAKQLQQGLKKSLGMQQQYAEKVVQLTLDMVGEDERAADKIRHIRRSALSDAEQQVDLIEQTQELLREGEKKFIEGDTEEAKRLAKKAEAIGDRITDEKTLIDTVKKSSALIKKSIAEEVDLMERAIDKEKRKRQEMKDVLDTVEKSAGKLKETLDSISSSTTSIQIKSNIANVRTQVAKLKVELQGLFGSGATVNSALSDVGSMFQVTPNAQGGIMTDQGAVPLQKYASGGIARSPQLALFGEGRQPEAYVPLPDGRSIPVKIEGGATGTTLHIGQVVLQGVQSAQELLDQLVEISNEKALPLNIGNNFQVAG